MKNKTLIFAGEDIVISHIVSVQAYEKNYKCYVVVKTISREYVEEFTEPGYSFSDYTNNLMNSSSDFRNFLEEIGQKITPEVVEINKKEFNEAGDRLRERAIERRQQILKFI